MGGESATGITGFVYFIQSGDGLGPVKIGFATNVVNRLRSLQTGHPYTLRIVGSVPGDIAKEREFHARFKTEWIRGEWFSYTGKLAEAMEEMFGAHPPRALDEAKEQAHVRTQRFAGSILMKSAKAEQLVKERAANEEAYLSAIRAAVDGAWKSSRYPLCRPERAAALLDMTLRDLDRLRASGVIPFWEGVGGDVAYHLRRIEAVAEKALPTIRAVRRYA